MKASTKSYLKRLARGQISIPWFIFRRLKPFRDLKLDLECRFNRAKPTLYGERTGMKGEVLCTFVISHKNCAEFAGLCVESIKRNAEDISYEILIADDNSEDSEFSEIKKIAAPGVCVYRFPQSKGHFYMLEWLYYRAESKFIVTLDQDTVLLSKNWGRLLDEFNDSQNTLMVGVRDFSEIRYSPQMLHPSFIIMNKSRCEKALRKPLFFGSRPGYEKYTIGQEEPYHSLTCKALLFNERSIKYLDVFQTKYGFGSVGYFRRIDFAVFYHQWFSGRIFSLKKKDDTIHEGHSVPQLRQQMRQFIIDYERDLADFTPTMTYTE